MSIQNKLGNGEELHSNCKRIRISTAWEINNPASWAVGGSALGAGKAISFYGGFNNQLFLMDSTDSSQYVNSKPSVAYRPVYYEGLFYNGKPVATLFARYPPEWEYGKGGAYLTTNEYSTRWLGGNVENTPVPSFKLIGPAIATSDLSFSHSPTYANSFVSSGKYDCPWVLGPGPREFPEIRGNPGPSPRPREPRLNDPPEPREDPETKEFDLISFFFFLEESDGSNRTDNRDYGDFSYITWRLEHGRKFWPGDDLFFRNIRADFTTESSLVPLSLLKQHGVTFVPDKKQILAINENDFITNKNRTRFIAKTYYGQELTIENKANVIVFEIPENAKTWSYSASPN